MPIGFDVFGGRLSDDCAETSNEFRAGRIVAFRSGGAGFNKLDGFTQLLDAVIEQHVQTFLFYAVGKIDHREKLGTQFVLRVGLIQRVDKCLFAGFSDLVDLTVGFADLRNFPAFHEASLGKVFWSELDLELHATALRLLGDRAELVDDNEWLDGYLFALSGPIYAGTNEIQRNIIAERVLGLPRR